MATQQDQHVDSVTKDEISGPIREDLIQASVSLINLVNDLFITHESDFTKIAAITADPVNQQHHATLTYAHLDEASNQIANFLTRSGIRIVGLLMRPSINWIISLIGIIRARAIYVPLEPTLPSARIQYIIEDSGLQIILRSGEYLDHNQNGIKTIDGPIKIVDIEHIITSEILSEPPEPISVPLPPQDLDLNPLFSMMYTSGSTGKPKGVKVSQSALLNRLQWQWETFPYDPMVDVGCCKTSLAFVDSICEVLGPLLKSIPIVIIQSSLTLANPAKLIATLNEHRISRLIVVPSLLTMIIEFLTAMNHQPLKHLRSIVCSGEELKPALLRRFFDCVQLQGVTLLNYYGSTEIMGDATYEVFTSKDDLQSKVNADGRVSIGTPIYNLKVHLSNLDENGIGEMIVIGAGVNQGYHRAPDKDKHRFLQKSQRVGGFRTGDLAKIIDGRLYFYGRNDSLVKIRGNRIDLSEIELALRTETKINNPIVLYDSEREAIVAFASVADPNAAAAKSNPQSIIDRLSTKLPSYALPSQMLILNDIPLLPASGKIDRQGLLSIARQQSSSCPARDTRSGSVNVSRKFSKEEIYLKLNHNQIPKMIALEEALVYLGIRFPPPVTMINKDDPLSIGFFQMGGNSMNAVMLVTYLARKGYMVHLEEFLLGRNTIKDLIDLMRPCHDQDPSGQVAASLMGLSINDLEAKYEAVPLEQIDQHVAINLIVQTFRKHTVPVVAWHQNKPHLMAQHDHEFSLFLEQEWQDFIREGLSFGIRRREDGALLGMSLGIDAIQHPHRDYSQCSFITTILRYIESEEGPLMEQLTQKEGLKRIADHFIVAVDDDESLLKPGEKTTAVFFAELKELEIATDLGFEAIVTFNVNPLTVHMGQFYLGYEIFRESYVHEYVDELTGERPFAAAASNPKDSKAQMCVKRLRQ